MGHVVPALCFSHFLQCQLTAAGVPGHPGRSARPAAAQGPESGRARAATPRPIGAVARALVLRVTRGGVTEALAVVSSQKALTAGREREVIGSRSQRVPG